MPIRFLRVRPVALLGGWVQPCRRSSTMSTVRVHILQHDQHSPWDPNYPIPRNVNPAKITRQEVLAKLQSGQLVGKELILIDLRREDFQASFSKNCLVLEFFLKTITREVQLRGLSIFLRSHSIQASQRCTHCLAWPKSRPSSGSAVGLEHTAFWRDTLTKTFKKVLRGIVVCAQQLGSMTISRRSTMNP